jgi:hypothetical protein
MRNQFKTIEAAKAAVESGIRVFWQNAGYELKKDSDGDWIIRSSNGFQSLLKDDGKAEDFYSEAQSTPTFKENDRVRIKPEWMGPEDADREWYINESPDERGLVKVRYWSPTESGSMTLRICMLELEPEAQ